MAAEPDPGGAGQEEMKKLEGTWNLVSSEQDGMKSDPRYVKNGKMIIKGNKMTVYGGKVVSSVATFSVDPAKKPKTIDATQTYGGPKGLKVPGIYELEDNILKMCFGDKQRPKDFSAKKGSGRSSDVWKRAGE